jgi:hypothetical protein
MREATDTGLDHDDRDPVPPHLGKAQQADETFELAGHLIPPMPLVERF